MKQELDDMNVPQNDSIFYRSSSQIVLEIHEFFALFVFQYLHNKFCIRAADCAKEKPCEVLDVHFFSKMCVLFWIIHKWLPLRTTHHRKVLSTSINRNITLLLIDFFYILSICVKDSSRWFKSFIWQKLTNIFLLKSWKSNIFFTSDVSSLQLLKYR